MCVGRLFFDFDIRQHVGRLRPYFTLACLAPVGLMVPILFVNRSVRQPRIIGTAIANWNSVCECILIAALHQHVPDRTFTTPDVRTFGALASPCERYLDTLFAPLLPCPLPADMATGALGYGDQFLFPFFCRRRTGRHLNLASWRISSTN
jgi:hypothetical protein